MTGRAWQIYGTASVQDILGDHVVFRNLQPMDTSLPGLPVLRDDLGIAPGDTPRKTTLDYAKVIHRILLAARPGDLKRIVYIGDTLFNDGSAFRNLVAVTGWDAAALITAENTAKPATLTWHPTPGSIQRLFTANRWGLVSEFQRILAHQGFAIDETTAVVVDLDKTLLGARGRNDRVIDAARLQAAYNTAEETLPDFDPAKFGTIYNILNQPAWHPITADNQDFLVYICLLVYGGFPPLDVLLREKENRRIDTFSSFETYIAPHLDHLPARLRTMHAEFQKCLAAGDPTPFKRFRQNEYNNTIHAMQSGLSVTNPDRLLADSITITAEVKAFVDDCRAQGALLFAISDKPDEASLPTAEEAARGSLPLHRTKAVVVGRAI
jgi:hypothetical protein